MKKIFIPMVALMATSALTSLSYAESKSLKLDEFSKVKIYAPVDLDVSVGKKQSFTMEGRSDDIAKLVVKVQGDTLIIKKEKKSDRMGKVMVALKVKELTKFTVNGSSDAKIRDVNSKSFDLAINGSGDVLFGGKSEELNVKINGSGDVVSKKFDAMKISTEINGSGDIGLAGKCDALKVEINGSGDFSGRELTCATVRADISGSGDVIVYASDNIRISSSGSSDVDIFGNPKSIKNSSSGSSDLIVHEDK